MTYEIYAFGSVTRGDVSPTSDVDILVLDDIPSNSRFPRDWSVYSRSVVANYYKSGRLFAWHLHLEAVLLHPTGGGGFLAKLGAPSRYTTATDDIADLRVLLSGSLDEIRRGSLSQVYELGLVYTALRDVAMSASWQLLGRPSFSRYAPYEITPPCPLPRPAYETAMKARHASTRGTPEPADCQAAADAALASPLLEWLDLIGSAA
jgi:hypothetical protein